MLSTYQNHRLLERAKQQVVNVTLKSDRRGLRFILTAKNSKYAIMVQYYTFGIPLTRLDAPLRPLFSLMNSCALRFRFSVRILPF